MKHDQLSEAVVQSLLLQLIVVIAACRLIAWIGRRFGQAETVGEMLAGIALGPTLFGYLAPDAFAYVFTPANGPVFSGIAQIGLVLLMFQIGLEFEFSAAAAAKRTVLFVGSFGMVVPFAIGSASALYFYDVLPEPRPDKLSFILIFATSMSITALPVLGRIFSETGMNRTRVGAIAISAAAINDVVGWLLLGVTTLMITGQFSASWVALRVFGLVGTALLGIYVVRPSVHRYLDRHLERNSRLKHTGISMVLILVCASALLTSRLGLHALIGGFILGLTLHQHQHFVQEWKTRIGPLVNTLFLPLFFAHTGLRTNIRSLDSIEEVGQALLICTLAFACKFGGGYLGARLAKEKHREAFVLGICMNTRGLMELVVLNIGYELGILPQSLFTMLVYMALITTVAATPLIQRYLRSEHVIPAPE